MDASSSGTSAVVSGRTLRSDGSPAADVQVIAWAGWTVDRKRFAEATTPQLKLSWDEDEHQIFTVSSKDWTELIAKTEAAAGTHVLKLQLADGWGVDVTSVTVAAK